jgi:mono/diheme cytochrome c family protein
MAPSGDAGTPRHRHDATRIPAPDISIMASVTRAPIATAAERQRRAAAQRRFDWRRPLRGLLGGIALAIAASSAAGADLPERLSDTGLNRDGVIAFEPQYSLWSDGTHKRRWLYLPPGRFIDASDADAWKFPRGTKLWKEFAYGSRIETRYITLGNDGQWRFATYVWNADGSAALLAPERGISRLPVADAPDGRYPVPSRNDCLICHEGARVPVLGFSALQLGDALPELVRRGLVRRAPAAWRDAAPRIAAASETERAARGHLHANCGHCHHESGAPVPLVLAQRVGGTPAPATTSLHTALRRMGTRDALQQMPPLGTRLVDTQGLAKLQAWLDQIAPAAPHTASTHPPSKEP